MTATDTGGKASTARYDNVACPFCGLLCDDLQISRSGAALKVAANGCPKAVAGFERQPPAAQPKINGKGASIEEAVSHAATILRNANLPLVTGLATDVEGIRAALAVAEKSGAVIDHALSDSSYRGYSVLQTSGYVLSTLTEARNRADLFIIAGSDVNAGYPRFFERVVNNGSMFTTVTKRNVVFLGANLDTSGISQASIDTIPVAKERIGETFDALRALAKKAPLTATEIAGRPRAEIEALLSRIQQSNYTVIVWSTSSYAYDGGDQAIQAICEFIKEMNQTVRVAGLTLGGNQGSTSAGAVCAWQTGYPLRISYASGAPRYDVTRYRAETLLNDGGADALLWTAAFTPDLGPPATSIPTIVLGTPGLKLPREPEVFIPVGTPGADHGGLLTRCDSVVSLPLQNLGRSELPSAASVLDLIERAL